MRNRTQELVPRPKGRKVVPSKWVFKHKKDEFGRIVRFKVRLGYTQSLQIGLLRYICTCGKASVTTEYTHNCGSRGPRTASNVVAAFLAGDLEEEIYMKQPEGFKQGNEVEDLVCLLQRGLYGLKQALAFGIENFSVS